VRIDDTIDASVGYLSEVKIGDHVNAEFPLGLIYCRNGSMANEAAQRIQAAYEIDDQSPKEIPQLMREVINE
jgi:thymidine phosphorylase